MAVFLFLIVYVLVSGLFLSALLPWWSYIVIAALTAFLLAQSGFKALVAGFMASFLPWLAMAAYLDTLSDGRMTSRVAALLGLELPLTLMLVSALIGGILGAAGAWIGWLIKWSFRRSRR